MNAPLAVARLLEQYPRERPPLTAAHAAVYESEYRRNRSGTAPLESVVARLEGWMHRQVAGGAGTVLELGAGTLNHLAYEPDAGAYDVVEPFAALRQDSPHRHRVRDAFADIGEIDGRTYDRIVSVAVLEHLTDLPAVLARSALLLAPGGRFGAGIPSEGGLLWGLSWRCTTGIAYRLRTGLDYGVVMRHEHVNTASEIALLVRWLFADVRIRRFPLPSAQLSFYGALDASRPHLDRAAWIEQTVARVS